MVPIPDEKKSKIGKDEAPKENILNLDANNDLKVLTDESGMPTLYPIMKIDIRAEIIRITVVTFSDPRYSGKQSITLNAQTFEIEIEKLMPFFAITESNMEGKEFTKTSLAQNPHLLFQNATNFLRIEDVPAKNELHFGFKRKETSNDRKTSGATCTYLVFFIAYLVKAEGNAHIPKFCRLTFKLSSAADKLCQMLKGPFDVEFPAIMTTTPAAWEQYKTKGFAPKSADDKPQMSIEACKVSRDQAKEKCELKAEAVKDYLELIQKTRIDALRAKCEAEKTASSSSSSLATQEKNSLKRKQRDEVAGAVEPNPKYARTEGATCAVTPQNTQKDQNKGPAFDLGFQQSSSDRNTNGLFGKDVTQQHICSEDEQTSGTNNMDVDPSNQKFFQIGPTSEQSNNTNSDNNEKQKSLPAQGLGDINGLLRHFMVQQQLIEVLQGQLQQKEELIQQQQLILSQIPPFFNLTALPSQLGMGQQPQQ